jgi:membrane associated rhomboid family serine protease
VSAGSPDLFVVCKSCGSEVSPYITECPYCGNRLRKRAPKIDREGRVTEKRLRRRARPSLPRLRGDEIPGIRPDRRPYGTLALLVAGFAGCIVWRTSLVNLGQIAIVGKPGDHWWRLLTAPFVYDNTGYAVAALGTIALFGWLLERRHGPLVVIGLFAIGGVGGMAAAAAVSSDPVALGGNGAALALLAAWAVPDLLALNSGEEVEGDLIGTAVIAAVIALMPLAVKEASWVSGAVGALAGLAAGLPLARVTVR